MQATSAILTFVKGGASTAVTLTVPAAGSYVITAKAIVAAAQDTGGTAVCSLLEGTLCRQRRDGAHALPEEHW